MERSAHLSSANSARMDVVDSRDNELRNSANKHANHQEHTAPPNLRDHTAVDDDDNNADGGQNARVLEGVANLCHFEEVGSVCWERSEKAS